MMASFSFSPEIIVNKVTINSGFSYFNGMYPLLFRKLLFVGNMAKGRGNKNTKHAKFSEKRTFFTP